MGAVRVEDWQRYALEHPCRTADEYTEAHRHTIVRGTGRFYVGLYFHWTVGYPPVWLSAAAFLWNDLIVPLATLDGETAAELKSIGELLLLGVGKTPKDKPQMLPPGELGLRFARVPSDRETALACGFLSKLAPVESMLPGIKEIFYGTVEDGRGRRGRS